MILELGRVFTEKPEHWPDKKCPECGDPTFRRLYPTTGKRQTLKQYMSMSTCGHPLCLDKVRRREGGNRKTYVDAPDIICPICGVTVTRPEDIPRWMWARQKTCNSAHCHSQAIWETRRRKGILPRGS